MPPSSKPRVFISYARRDGADLAQRLQADLEKQGFNAWIDKQRIEGGASWTNNIEKAIDDADYLLALLNMAPMSQRFAAPSSFARYARANVWCRS